MELKYFSTFTGIGGFELGINKAYEHISNKQLTEIKQNRKRGNGVTNKMESNVLPSSWSLPLCVGYSEIDKYATQIYKKHFPGHKNYGDITTINVSELPDFDLLVGGFPCQSFSIAGKRKGFEDTRGTLFFELARILRDKKPRLFVFENVKGLLSHDNGQTFKTIIATLTELGYDLQWQVLNSKNFGVPQNRERVFIVGHLRGTSRPQVFPIGKSNAILNKDKIQKLAKSMTSSMHKGVGNDGMTLVADYRYDEGLRIRKKFISPCLIAKGHSVTDISTMPPVILRGRPKMPYENGKRKLEYKTYDKIVPTISTNCGSGDQKNMVVQAIKYGQNNSDRNGNISDDMFTLKAGGSNAGITDGIKIRRLTPTECERLQGFPDGWTEGISDSQRYKCLGNAVTVNVVSEIIKNILYE